MVQKKRASRTGQPTTLGAFTYPKYPYVRPTELNSEHVRHVPVVVVGGGMVGLTLAIDLGRKGVPCILLDDNDTVSAGSRSIAQARRTMEIWSRLGCADPMSTKGVSWSRGHTHYGPDTILSFDVFPEGGSRYPSFTSLAQYYVEHYLVERGKSLESLDIRWLHRVESVKQTSSGVELSVDTPDGNYKLIADWVVAADGAKSTVRQALGLEFPGDRLQDKFVIADVSCRVDLPLERNYWFEPPFYEGNSVLRVPQSDSIWRIDWQIDVDTDVEKELAPETVHRRLEGIFGEGVDFQVEWASTYTSEHRLMDSFKHGRVLFVGDAAHQFSPFGGGRGGNSGIQDADNLGWKLAAVIAGEADPSLLDTYSAERRPIAVRNIADSSTSTEFITPKSSHSQALHDAVLALAKKAPFAKRYVNTGRFAVWPVLEESTLSVPDADHFAATGRPGTPVLDCPLFDSSGNEAWLTDQVGDDFVLVVYDQIDAFGAQGAVQPTKAPRPMRVLHVAPPGSPLREGSFEDATGAFARQYGAQSGTTYLFRPDQHVLARWRQPSLKAAEDAITRVLGTGTGGSHEAKH